ncbi:hypothetical protein HDU81_002783 [Chytriomyces hyalinus]|nr:hypothetical protein HDU81_002783 [Chytriomyces hyalinus]
MPSLQALPIEIIDTLVPLLDVRSLFHLCHCLPRLKPLSKAIFDVSSTILDLDVDNVEYYVWPRFELGQDYDKCPPDSYFESFRTGEASLIQYAKMLNRFGGALDLTMCCERHLHCYRQFLPRRIMLTIQLSVTPPDQIAAILRTLSLWKVDLEVLSFQPDDEADDDNSDDGLEGVDVSAIQNMRVSTLKLLEMSAALLGQLPQIKGLKTLHLGDPAGFEHIAPMVSLECLVIGSSDTQHQNEVQNAIVKGTHPNLKRVEVHYSKWTTDGYTMWAAKKRCEKRLKPVGWVVHMPKDVNESISAVAWTRE